jgi:hypothetical protein
VFSHLNLRHYLSGTGLIEPTATGLRLETHDAASQQYSDAQLDDVNLAGGLRFRWRPPLKLSLRARFSHPAGELQGTAGFGFWNYPWLPVAPSVPRLPQAVWFFYGSPPSNMKLDLLCPGHGWKAATIDAGRPSALALIPCAPPAVLLMQFPPLYHALWPMIQTGVGVRETPVAAPMTAWHSYELEWGLRYARFWVDGQLLLDRAPSPRGPLCFVAWIDNQYLIVTPQGRFGWGLLDAPGSQWLELADLTITPG